MEPNINLNIKPVTFITAWQESHTLVTLGLINAFQLALILEKLSGNELTPDLKEKTMVRILHLFLDLDFEIYNALGRLEPTPEALREMVLEKLKAMKLV